MRGQFRKVKKESALPGGNHPPPTETGRYRKPRHLPVFIHWRKDSLYDDNFALSRQTLTTKLFIFFFVLTALDSPVDNVAQLVEADFLIDALRTRAFQQIHFVIIGAVECDNDVSAVQPSVDFKP